MSMLQTLRLALRYSFRHFSWILSGSNVGQFFYSHLILNFLHRLKDYCYLVEFDGISFLVETADE